MDSFQEKFGAALLQVLYKLFVYFLFIVPFDLWVRAMNNLAKQKESGSLSINSINSAWSFLSFLKRFFFEFLFDAFIFLSYFIGIIAALFMLYSQGFQVFAGALVITYYVPVILSFYKDIFIILLLPFAKFISWASKPAQYMDLEIKNK